MRKQFLGRLVCGAFLLSEGLFLVQGKMATGGCQVTSLEDTDNLGFGFEITGNFSTNDVFVTLHFLGVGEGGIELQCVFK